jgi:hypothetical protein
MEYPHSMDEHVAASAVAALGVNGKRDREDVSIFPPTKMHRVQEFPSGAFGPTLPLATPQGVVVVANDTTKQPKILKAFPYFYYRDFSQIEDADPFTPLTVAGRVPNFPAKLHSILSRPDLADIVSWVSKSPFLPFFRIDNAITHTLTQIMFHSISYFVATARALVARVEAS